MDKLYTNAQRTSSSNQNYNITTLDSHMIPDKNFKDSMMNLVKELWHEAIGIFPASIDDNFFDSGGDSLSAVCFSIQLKHKTGLFLNLITFTNPTIKNIVEYLCTQNKNSFKHTSFVTIQETTHPIPFVLIHPIGGDLYFYKDLISCLPKICTIYGIRSPLLEKEEKCNSIESLSEYYVHILNEYKIATSCVLIGASFGGILAYEMAQQICKMHKITPTLFMIDAPAYTALPNPISDADILAHLVKYNFIDGRVIVDFLKNIKTLDDQIDFIVRKIKKNEKGHLLSKEFIYVYLNVWKKHGYMMQKYKPQPYVGDITFFTHTEIIDAFPSYQNQHWEPLIKGCFTSIAVPGDHFSMNEFPHVKKISDHLEHILKR